MDYSNRMTSPVSYTHLITARKLGDDFDEAAVLSLLTQNAHRAAEQTKAIDVYKRQNFPTILNRLTGMFSEDRADFIASFDEYDLLIIDDLGVERSTEYAMEQMFFVIDSRYRSRRPMIITRCV